MASSRHRLGAGGYEGPVLESSRDVTRSLTGLKLKTRISRGTNFALCFS